MPAARSSKKRADSAGHVSNKVEPCDICGQVVSRASDIPRHKKKHDAANKLPCPWAGCDFSTLQKSNLNTHYRSQQKRLHNYIPNTSIRQKSNKLGKAPAYHGHNPSVESSSSVTSPFVEGSSLGSNSPVYTSPSSYTNSRSPSYSPPYGESKSTISTSTSYTTFLSYESINSPQHPEDSLLFSGSAYNHAWDQSLLPELDFLAAMPETEQYESQVPYQGQHEEPQPKDSSLPLLFPKVEPGFPGHRTAGRLRGACGLDVGLEQPPHQGSLPEVNNDNRFSSSTNNLPAQVFHAPVEPDYRLEICSPVRMGSPQLDIESGWDVGFGCGIVGNTDSTQMTSSSCDFNSFHVDPHPSADPTVFTYPTNAQFYQAPSTPISYANVDPQTPTNAGFINFPFSAPCVGYYDYNGNLHVYQTSAGLDYFDQCQWDFGFDTSNIIQGPYYDCNS
ncbi:hypothetical protein BYT27DRAFT_7212441 [Phlegmacium glaucopus]|nr:hypothetical protein BYT27DRAFT_7212441 [Phlegmacium glaucopus]